MPSLSKLSDAAVVLTKALDELNVEHGMFGGYAIAILGGPRESKDIDCVVNCGKEWLVATLSKVKGFKSTGNMRPDLASFLYGEYNILIELFPTSMSAIRTQQVQVSGERSDARVTKILHPAFVYKGKLQAAATRAKHSDAVDLLYLEGAYRAALIACNDQFSTCLVGMTLKRYGHLQASFVRLGLDLKACIESAKDIDVDALPPIAPPNSIQNGLLFNVGVPKATSQNQHPATSSSRQPAVDSTQAQSYSARSTSQTQRSGASSGRGNAPEVTQGRPPLPLDQPTLVDSRHYLRTRRGLFVANGSEWTPVPPPAGPHRTRRTGESDAEEDDEDDR